MAKPGYRQRHSTVHHFRIPDDVYAAFQKAREDMKPSVAVTEALRDWSTRRVAGDQADFIAPLLQELINQRVDALEDRLVKLLVRIGYLSTTNVELLLEQRRRSGMNLDALFQEIGPRIDRRWRRPRDFSDLPLPDSQALQQP